MTAAVVASTPAFARDTSAPPTRKEAVVDTHHGQRVEDPYRWLEKGDDPAVRAWTASQSERTRRYLDALPFRGKLHARLEKLITETSPRYFGLHEAGGQVFAF